MSDYILDIDRDDYLDLLTQNLKWSNSYSKLIEEPKRGDETGVYASVNLKGEVVSSLKILPNTIKTSFDLLEAVVKRWPDRPFLGHRKVVKQSESDTIFGDYVWSTYKEAHRLIKVIGTALTSYDDGIPTTVVTDCNFVKSAKFVGILAKNSPKWLMIDYACIAYNLVSVPLYETLGLNSILYIMNQTDSSKLQLIYENQDKLSYIKLIIILDEVSKENESYINELKFNIIKFASLVNMYEDKIVEPVKLAPDDLATIIYTSGTTGLPKGVVYTHDTFVNHILRYVSVGNRLKLHKNIKMFSFLPLPHVYQRFIEHALVIFRCQIGYFSGDTKNILSDIKALKPTFLVGVPRIYNKIHANISKAISEKPAFLQKIIKKAIVIRAKSLRENVSPLKLFFSNLVLSKITKMFGGKLITLVTGSAPLNQNVWFDIQGMLGASLTEGWGMTENGFTLVREMADTDSSIAGGPLGAIQFKLRSLPELSYLVTDSPPRGELMIRGHGFFKCYFRNISLTAETIDKDGWTSTGDVIEISSTNGIRIIDRAKSMFKLSQGEYIAPEKLENAYIMADMIEQIYVHGQTDKSFLVAVVVVTPENKERWELSLPEPHENMEELLESHILDQLDTVAKNNKFNALERIKRAHITTELFTIDNGLITSTFKNVRKKIAAHYKTQIDEMYLSQEGNLSTIKF